MSNLRFGHTMIRVIDLEKSIKFYEDVFKMKVNKKTDYPNGKFTLAFLGYGDIDTHPQIELTYNWETSSYTMGDAFGHLALIVDDIYDVCNEAKEKGANIIREPAEMKYGGSIIAFIQDPDGYKIELVQNTKK